MIKYKVSSKLNEETKDTIETLFLFRFISFIELIGFSFIISLIIITFSHSKPNVFLVFLPIFFGLSILYVWFEKTKPRGTNKTKGY